MWHDLGPVERLTRQPLTAATIGTLKVVVTHQGGAFGVLSGVCNHAGGPLADGRLDGDYVVCPWHNWKYHCRTGQGEPGYDADAVPRYDVKVEAGHLFASSEPATKRTRGEHPLHPLARKIERAPGPVRVVGISTTNMDINNPRYSTSDALLNQAMQAAAELHADTQTIRLAELTFRPCEGYYSKSAQLHEAIVHWADVILLATPIGWGNSSSPCYRMVERLNCVQNQVTIANRVLMHNKVAGFIITGGQDNVEAVAVSCSGSSRKSAVSSRSSPTSHILVVGAPRTWSGASKSFSEAGSCTRPRGVSRRAQ